MKTIIKRNGEPTSLDQEKIKRVILTATENIDVDLNILEKVFYSSLKDNVHSKDVMKILIDCSLKLTDVKNIKDLNWRFVASRLVLMNLYKEASISRNYSGKPYANYYDFVAKCVQKEIYHSNILKYYTEEEIKQISSIINPDYDLAFDYAGINLLDNRYLLKHKGLRYELPQEMYLTIALFLAIPEKKENRLNIAEKIYHSIAGKKISLATPILLNLRKVYGNLASCFILAVDDSLDSIMYSMGQIGQISKNAGGVGVNISRIRSEGAYIKKKKGASGGIIPWIKIMNDTVIAVNQEGARKGAATVAIDIWHADIDDFLELQTENGDQRRKAFDVFPQIVVPDLFMHRVDKNQKWTLFDPHEVRTKFGIELAELYGEEFEKQYKFLEKQELDIKKTIKAKELFKKFLKVVVEAGMPYVAFKDTINETNPNKHSGMIGNANLCVESFSNFSPSKLGDKILSEDKKSIQQQIEPNPIHTCNLVSVVLSHCKDYEEIQYNARLATRILDNTIDLTDAPVPEAQKHNTEYRILGVGAMGLADWFVKKKILYKNGSEESERVSENIAYACLEESNKLGIERGNYQYFEGSEYSKGIVFGKDKKWFEQNETNIPKEQWLDLINKCSVNMRNGSLNNVPPQCQDPNNKVQTSNGVFSLYEMLKINNIDINSIETSNQKQWIDLKNPIKVPTYEGEDVCERIWYNGLCETIDLEFEDGNTYSFTPNHKLLAKRNGEELWIRCDELIEGDDIVQV